MAAGGMPETDAAPPRSDDFCVNGVVLEEEKVSYHLQTRVREQDAKFMKFEEHNATQTLTRRQGASGSGDEQLKSLGGSAHNFVNQKKGEDHLRNSSPKENIASSVAATNGDASFTENYRASEGSHRTARDAKHDDFYDDALLHARVQRLKENDESEIKGMISLLLQRSEEIIKNQRKILETFTCFHKETVVDITEMTKNFQEICEKMQDNLIQASLEAPNRYQQSPTTLVPRHSTLDNIEPQGTMPEPKVPRVIVRQPRLDVRLKLKPPSKVLVKFRATLEDMECLVSQQEDLKLSQVTTVVSGVDLEQNVLHRLLETTVHAEEVYVSELGQWTDPRGNRVVTFLLVCQKAFQPRPGRSLRVLLCLQAKGRDRSSQDVQPHVVYYSVKRGHSYSNISGEPGRSFKFTVPKRKYEQLQLATQPFLSKLEASFLIYYPKGLRR